MYIGKDRAGVECKTASSPWLRFCIGTAILCAGLSIVLWSLSPVLLALAQKFS